MPYANEMEENQYIPSFLVELLNRQYGEETAKKILDGYKVKRKTTLRINTLKTNADMVKKVLRKAEIDFKEVKWNENALILNNADENDIRSLSIYENGKIYMQSLSSMLPPIMLDPHEGENILDMAAAPGSKTTQIAAMTNNKCMITACEMNRARSERLKYNLEKQGVTCSYVMVTDSRRLNDFFSFDKILLDAPCSGSGTLDAYNEATKKNFTTKLIQKSVEAQTALLKKALKVLKSGGEMIYSTCSVLESENEKVLENALRGTKAQIVPINLDKTQFPLLDVKIPGTICVCPNEYFEGFFIAKIKKM